MRSERTPSQQTRSQRSTGVRLGSFALVLAATFGTAYALGERLPGHNHPPANEHPHDHATDGDQP